MNALIAETEAEERRELEEVKELHKKEAIAYVNQLRKAVENQRFEDEELEELIKAKMEEPCHSEPRQFRGKFNLILFFNSLHILLILVLFCFPL